jgi:hypothetical protein
MCEVSSSSPAAFSLPLFSGLVRTIISRTKALPILRSMESRRPGSWFLSQECLRG